MRARAFAMVLAGLAAAGAIAAGNSLPASLQRTAANFARVRDYSVDGSLTLNSPKAYVRDMRFRVYYKRPDKVKIVAKEGFALLPKDTVAIGDPVRELQSNYDVVSMGDAKLGGAACELIKAEPKAESGRSVTMKLWVERRRGLILRTETVSEYGGSARTSLSYVMAGGSWMPSRIESDIVTGKRPSEEGEYHHHRRYHGMPPVSGKLTIVFSGYRINRGIPDGVFGKG